MLEARTEAVTRTPLSRSPGHFTQRGLNAQGGCSGQRGNVFDVVKYCYVASAWRRAWAPTGRGEGGGILCRHAHSLLNMQELLNTSTESEEAERGSRFSTNYRRELMRA